MSGLRWLAVVIFALAMASGCSGDKTDKKGEDDVFNPGWVPTVTDDTGNAGDVSPIPGDPDLAIDPDDPDAGDDPADAGVELADDPDPTDVVEELLPQQPGDCIDADGDGYGENCYFGDDCDDTNPFFTVYCALCDTQTVEGCKCFQEGASEVCFEGDPGSVGIGECQLGQRYCKTGYWTGCIGQIVPQAEICDDLDNDCDGTVDEGVTSPCGDCDPMCDTLIVGPESDQPFAPSNENSDGVGTNIDGYLILDSSQIDLSFIWVANSGENTVSKLDTKTGTELGRYHTCGNPSRTAVDLLGNVWVGCRSGGGVAKIAIDEAICVDKNGNGVIDTSQGSQPMPNGTDECVLFVVYPGGSCQRALGVDSENHAWVGEWNGKVLRRLHPETGAVVGQQIGIPVNPYGLAIDGDGVIWVSGRGGSKLVRADPNLNPASVNSWPVPSGDLYGIAIDAKGKIWLGQFGQNRVARFDPATNQFTSITSSLGGHCPRGMAGSVDGYMYAGLGCGSDHYVARIDIDTHAVTLINTNGNGSGTQSIGVALDSEGYIWAVNYKTSNASKIDPETHQVQGPYPVGKNPYTYSDMTGYALHNFTAPQGNYETVFGGWEEFRVKWTALFVDAEIPQDAFLKLEVRTANSEAELMLTKWEGLYGPYPPNFFPLDLTTVPNMDEKLLQVRVWLYSGDKTSTPIVKAIKAKFASE